MRVVGRYVLHTKLASGGMGAVYLGRIVGAAGFSRVVAIKALHPQLASERELVDMFLDEARLAAQIKHPNVVPTLEVVQADGELLLVMEYVHGETLGRINKLLGDYRVPVRHAVTIVTGVLHGLHAAHEAIDTRGRPMGIVHRDVSPQNILVGSDGVTRVVDFGVAKARGRMHTTQDGRLKGKLAYMSPEQLRGLAVDRRVDIFAASIVLWELLTGERLFAGAHEGETVARVLACKVPAPSARASWVPPVLDAIVLRGLAADRATRFQSAREMARALEEAIEPVLASDVAEWVERVAAEPLAKRAAAIKAVEVDPDGGTTQRRKIDAVREPAPSTALLDDDDATVTDVDPLAPPAPAAEIAPASGRESTDLIDTIPGARKDLKRTQKIPPPPPSSADALVELPVAGPPAQERTSKPPERVSAPPAASRGRRRPSPTTAPSLHQGRTLFLVGAFVVPALVAYLVTSRPWRPSGAPAAPHAAPSMSSPSTSSTPAAADAAPQGSADDELASPLWTPDEERSASRPVASPARSEAKPHPDLRRAAGQRSDADRARDAMIAGRLSEARAILEGKVFSGRGNADEINLLRAICKGPPRDQPCLDAIKKHQ